MFTPDPLLLPIVVHLPRIVDTAINVIERRRNERFSDVSSCLALQVGCQPEIAMLAKMRQLDLAKILIGHYRKQLGARSDGTGFIDIPLEQWDSMRIPVRNKIRIDRLHGFKVNLRFTYNYGD